MAVRFLSLVSISALTLAGCSAEPDAPATTEVPIEETSTPQEDGGTAPSEQAEGATPNAERVATLGLLNKRNNVSEDIEIKPGETREIGPVILTLATCERTASWEFPQETGAFVQVDILDRGQSEHARVFSGWLFKESPSLNVVEHPIYDVWVKDCAMSWPGE